MSTEFGTVSRSSTIDEVYYAKQLASRRSIYGFSGKTIGISCVGYCDREFSVPEYVLPLYRLRENGIPTKAEVVALLQRTIAPSIILIKLPMYTMKA